MSDANNNDQCAPSNGPGGESAGPPKETLARVESLGIAPDAPGEAVNAEAVKPSSAQPTGKPEPKRAHIEPAQESHQASHAEAAAAVGGTALVLARPRLKAEAPEPEPAKASPQSSSLCGLRRLAAMVAVAAAVGGLAGSLATAGIGYLTASQPAAPINYAAFTDALGRIDRELAVLKAGVDSSAKTTSQQVAKIADRMDRAEKAQAEAGSKLAKASDLLDRVEKKLNATPNDVTGTIGETHVAVATPPVADAKRPSPALLVDGWVLRDVYNGAAMIQGRGGVIAVLPGDTLPGLGRIEQIKRQDGRWVVVTSRGLIVSR